MSAAVKKTRRVAPRTRRAVIGSKGGQAKQKKPSIAQNSVPSISTARIVYLWSWGPIVGLVDGLRSLKLDGTPVQAPDGTINYPGVKWQFRNGELNQERLEGNTESSNEIDVKQELIFGTPWLHTITNSVSDAIRLRLSWPTLRSQDAAGNINGVRIDYAVDISTDNGPYVEALVSFVDRKNVTEYERAHRLELPAGSRWTIRVRRLTPNANSDLVADQMVVKAIAEVVDSDQEYPLTAVSSIEYDAQTFGGDIAKIAALMRGRIIRVPSNYDAETRTYATSGTGTSNGIWDGTFKEAYTNNPAWIFYDLVLHPYYGLGDRIDATMVDRWSLYRIAQYCDQMVPDGKGGMEPRFTCNLYFQKQAEAYAVLQDLASIFHGLAFWDGSQIVVNADMPGDPVYTYNQTQILNNGAIKYEGTRARDRHTLYMVSWDNPDQGFETDKEPVFDDEAMVELGGMVRETTVGAIGCTSLGQAQRAGHWAALTEKLQTQGGVFRVGLDGDIPKPGQVIAVADPMLVGRNNGGRISAAAGRVVTLDRDTTVPVGARLLVNLPSGKSEGRIVKSVAGRDVTVMADFSEQPQAESGWILDYEDLKLMQFYVRNVTRPEWHQFQFEVIQHDPSKFPAVDNGAVVDTRPITGIPVGTQDAPDRVMLSQHVVIEQGIAVTVMSIAWDAAPNAVGYDVEWKWGAREWVPVPRTGELMADVRGIYSGQYMARVRAVSALNVSSIPVTSALTNLEGKAGKPPAVAFLTTISLVYGIGIQWGFPPGAEDTQRTEVWYSESPDLTTAVKLSDFSYPQASHEMHSLLAGASLFFWARLVDRTGNVGPFFPTPGTVNGQASSDQSEYEKYFADKISEGALWKPLRDRIDLIDGPETLAGSVAQRVAAEATARAKAVSDEALARAQGLLAEAQARGTAITSEANARVAADSALGQRIDTVTAATGGNAAAIQTEITARTNADSALGQRIDTVASGTAANTAAIGNETTARTNADTALASQISTIRAQSGGFDTSLNFDFASTVEGWSGTRCDLSVETGRMIVTNTSANAYLNSPGTSINGREHDRVRCRITRRAGSGWNGQITYVTPSHGSSTSFNKIIPDPGLTIGQSVIVEWDMSQLTNGGNDWSSSTITRFYLWLSSASGDVFEVDWIAIGRIAPSASVASVVDERTARITGDESNASATTALASSLNITNTNVTAAQKAANDANTLAGGKGKVIVQAAAPAAADQLPQNLWIDITGGANTPKRWTGSAWAAVSDKVATDAAKAASDALAVANTKADASTVTALSNTVTQQGNTITAQGGAITSIRASIGQQLDNLLIRGNFEDGLADPWTTYSAAPATAVVPVVSSSTAFSKAIAFYDNSFCGVSFNILTVAGEQFDVTAEISGDEMSPGQTGSFQMQFYSSANVNLGYVTAFSFAATTGKGFKQFSGRITAPANAVSARFLTRIMVANGVGRALWCNIAARRVTAADAANASATSSLAATVTDLDGKITAQSTSNEALRASVRGDDGSGDLAAAIKAWESTANFEIERKVQASANEALARTTETLQSNIGETSASVQAVSETLVNLDGRVSAQTTIKAQTIANGKKVIAGLALGSDGETSEILAFAQRFAIVDEVSGQLITPFVVSGGQVFINQAVINKAFIQEIILGMTLRSEAVDSRGRPLLEINVKAGTFVLRGDGTGGSILLNNNGLAVYDGNDVRRTMTGNLRL